MEAEVTSSRSAAVDHKGGKELVRVKRKTIEKVLEQCQRALESLGNADALMDDEEDDRDDDVSQVPELSRQGSMAIRDEREVDEAIIAMNSSAVPQIPSDIERLVVFLLCDLLKSRVVCPDFLEKLECAQPPVTPNTADENSSWDFINENDLWEREDTEADKDEYVLVMQEDIVDGIACFMATYLASLKETKELSPNQLQEALSKTFSTKKKKGKLRKAWDGSKVLYNVASWGATAIGIYQNPLLFNAASKAFWTSCHVVSKLL